MKKLLLVACCLVGANTHANVDETTTSILTGKCSSLTAFDKSVNKDFCSDKLLNIEYPNGRLGFYFTLGTDNEADSTIISFSGYGSNQIKKDKNNVLQPIDYVHISKEGFDNSTKAVGTCSFGNPYQNKPVTIDCKADTNIGKFAIKFITDGKVPESEIWGD